MKLKYLLVAAFVALLTATSFAQEENLIHFTGTVTAVNSNGNKPGRSFTAVDGEGKVKMFYIASLSHLDEGDRVVLSYLKGSKYPLNVVRIKFLPPAK